MRRSAKRSTSPCRRLSMPNGSAYRTRFYRPGWQVLTVARVESTLFALRRIILANLRTDYAVPRILGHTLNDDLHSQPPPGDSGRGRRYVARGRRQDFAPHPWKGNIWRNYALSREKPLADLLEELFAGAAYAASGTSNSTTASHAPLKDKVIALLARTICPCLRLRRWTPARVRTCR